jgi:hypothetical protein
VQKESWGNVSIREGKGGEEGARHLQLAYGDLQDGPENMIELDGAVNLMRGFE